MKRGVGGTPRFIERGEGSRIFDVDGNSYIDYVGSWGPLLLGHRAPKVIEALRNVLDSGTSFGAPTERECELAELIRQAGKKNLGGATLAYTQLTLSCVHCHNVVRDAKKGK